jgi:hypothetical protein
MTDEECQYVADYIAIRQLSNRYQRVADEYDSAAYPKLFVEDGMMVLEGDENQETQRFVGPEQLSALVEATRDSGFHIMTNPLVDLDGDRARQTSRLLMLRMNPDGESMSVIRTATYTDELVRTPEGWLFKSRRVKTDSPQSSSVPQPGRSAAGGWRVEP